MRSKGTAVAVVVFMSCLIALPTTSSGAARQQADKTTGQSTWRRWKAKYGPDLLKLTRAGINLGVGYGGFVGLKALAAKAGVVVDPILLRAFIGMASYATNEAFKAATNKLFAKVERPPPKKYSAIKTWGLGPAAAFYFTMVYPEISAIASQLIGKAAKMCDFSWVTGNSNARRPAETLNWEARMDARDKEMETLIEKLKRTKAAIEIHKGEVEDRLALPGSKTD